MSLRSLPWSSQKWKEYSDSISHFLQNRPFQPLWCGWVKTGISEVFLDSTSFVSVSMKSTDSYIIDGAYLQKGTGLKTNYGKLMLLDN